MRTTRRLAIFLALAIGWYAPALQALTSQDRETGAITGHVMLEGKPAPGVIVAATPAPPDNAASLVEQMLKPPTSFRGVTDSEGRYTIENLPFGTYLVGVSSKVLINSNASEKGLTITVGDTTTVERVDFSLQRTGVITGKITDSEGRPVISERITLKAVVDNPIPDALASFAGVGDRMFYTDDRGVYRIFGIRPGRYIVSAGGAQNSVLSVFLKQPKRALTFYPAASDPAAAVPVEVGPGSEVTGIDIKLGVADKGFVVSGRLVDAETRTPIADAMVGYSKATPAAKDDHTDTDADNDDDTLDSFSGALTTTNARGEFRFESVAPGRYKLEASSMGAVTGSGSFYGDPLDFEVRYSNVDKLEIKVHRGATISGVVVLENAEGADSLSEMSGFVLAAIVTDSQMKPVSQTIARVAADSTFQLSGLRPGTIKIGALPYGQQRFAVLRVERNGTQVTDGFEIQGNEQIAGVRVILTRANCVIRGHVTLQGGELSRGSAILITARRPNQTAFNVLEGVMRSATADSNGDFLIENLAPGTYEVSARVGAPPASSSKSTTQTVTLGSGSTVDITLIIDLSAK